MNSLLILRFKSVNLRCEEGNITNFGGWREVFGRDVGDYCFSKVRWITISNTFIDISPTHPSPEGVEYH